MKPADLYGPVCGCQECRAAGVEREQTRRDPATGRLLHGFELKRGLEAFARFQREARAAIGPKQARGGGFTRLVRERDPGEEG